jgi:hypothetical protein
VTRQPLTNVAHLQTGADSSPALRQVSGKV